MNISDGGSFRVVDPTDIQTLKTAEYEHVNAGGLLADVASALADTVSHLADERNQRLHDSLERLTAAVEVAAKSFGHITIAILRQES